MTKARTQATQAAQANARQSIKNIIVEALQEGTSFEDILKYYNNKLVFELIEEIKKEGEHA